MLTNDEIIRRWDGLDIELKSQFSKIADKQDGHDARLKDLEQTIARRRTGGGDQSPASWGRSMVDSEEFRHLAKTKRGTARIEVKTTITSSAGSGGDAVAVDQRVDPVIMPRRRLGIRDLLSQGNTTSNSVRYVQQATRDVHAAIQTEGQAKREAALTLDSETANVATIAVWIPAHKQVLDDAPALMALIDSELKYGVAYTEQEQILLGDGSGENLSGLIPNSTSYSAPFTADMQQRIDAILQAQAQLEAADLEATGVVLNPIDWARIRGTKNSEGNYLAGGPMSAAPRQLWDLPVVSSNSIPAGYFLTGDFKRAALVLDRQEVTVEISTEHDDFFVRNLVAIRAEKRLALVLNMPSALIYGALPSVT